MFSIGNALGQGFRIWGRNIVPFTLLGLIVYLPVLLYVMMTVNEQMTLTDLNRLVLVLILAPILLNIFITGTVTYGVVMEMRGQHASMGASVAAGLKRFLPALGVSILAILAVIFGILLLLVGSVIFFCMFYVAVPASIMEKPGLIGALKRSRELTAGNKLNIFGLLFIFGLITGIPRTIVEKIIMPNAERATLGEVKQFIYVSLGFTIVIGTLGAVVAAVTYFQLRQDKDGVSIDEIARVFD